MQNPDSLLPTDFGFSKKKRVGRIIDDDEVSPCIAASALSVQLAHGFGFGFWIRIQLLKY
jgi:hypothetical protein